MIAHTELASDDPAATKNFLESVFHWKFRNIDRGEMMIAYETPGGSQGSIRRTAEKEIPRSLNYVLVKDLEEAENKIKSSGGEIILPRVDVPEMGSFFWFKVPGGPVLACWMDDPKRKL